MIQQAVAKLVERQNLSEQESFEAMSAIMSGTVSEPLISGFLVALRMKGETIEEITGCARAMRDKSLHVASSRKNILDTCGTGGDGSGTFNISTVSAIVASAAGATIAKHGNRSVSSKSGSADVLKALGVNIDLEPQASSRVLDEVGITFLFAPVFHRAMKFAVPVRKELGLRTIFNVLGPLTNPAGAKFQLLGVFRRELTEPLAGALRSLGSQRALVVHGNGGLDEFSTFGTTTVSELNNGEIRTYEFDASSVGIPKSSLAQLQGGDPEHNAGQIRSILAGAHGPHRDITLLNAGAALYAGGLAASIAEGIKQSTAAIDSGSASKKLSTWVEASNAQP